MSASPFPVILTRVWLLMEGWWKRSGCQMFFLFTLKDLSFMTQPLTTSCCECSQKVMCSTAWGESAINFIVNNDVAFFQTPAKDFSAWSRCLFACFYTKSVVVLVLYTGFFFKVALFSFCHFWSFSLTHAHTHMIVPTQHLPLLQKIPSSLGGLSGGWRLQEKGRKCWNWHVPTLA